MTLTPEQTIELLRSELDHAVRGRDKAQAEIERLQHFEKVSDGLSAKVIEQQAKIERLKKQRDRWIETCKAEHELATKLQAFVDVAKKCVDEDDSYYNVTHDLVKALATLKEADDG